MEKITLTGVNETMLVPLYARAQESKRKNPNFVDETAVRVVNSLNYDFSKCNQKMNIWGCCARTTIFDRLAKEFIQKYPDCIVINLGCGLDDRFSRVDNGKLNWYNVEFQNVLEIREQFIPPHKKVTNIASSALDFRWVKKVDKKDDVLVIAEGLLMYFTKYEVINLFHELSLKFKNVTILAELMTNFMIKNQTMHSTTRETGAVFKFGVENAKEMEEFCKGYKCMGEYNFTNEMKQYSPIFISIISGMLKNANNRIGVFRKEGN